jgi:hypothetical protein
MAHDMDSLLVHKRGSVSGTERRFRLLRRVSTSAIS